MPVRRTTEGENAGDIDHRKIDADRFIRLIEQHLIDRFPADQTAIHAERDHIDPGHPGRLCDFLRAVPMHTSRNKKSKSKVEPPLIGLPVSVSGHLGLKLLVANRIASPWLYAFQRPTR
jgi:hypothetical protein